MNCYLKTVYHPMVGNVGPTFSVVRNFWAKLLILQTREINKKQHKKYINKSLYLSVKGI